MQETKDLKEMAGLKTVTVDLYGREVILAPLSLNARVAMEDELGGGLEVFGQTAKAMRLQLFHCQKRAGGTMTLEQIGDLVDETTMPRVMGALQELLPGGGEGNTMGPEGTTGPGTGNGPSGG